VFWKECRGLAGAGYDVVLLTADRPARDGIVHVEAVRHPSNRFTRFTVTAARLFLAALRTRGDLFHAHDPELLPCLQLLRLLGHKVIFDMHENTPKALVTKEWLPRIWQPLVARCYLWLERVLLTGIPVVFAEDSYVCDYQWIKTAAVVRNFPILSDVWAAAGDDEADRFTLIYCGAISVARGSISCIEAVAECRRRGLNVCLELIGSITGSHRQELTHLIESRQLADVVSLRDPVEPPRAWHSISRAHIGLALLHAEPNYVGSIPTKLLEYMALGKAVVASHFPLYRHIVEGNRCGFCVDPQSVADVADALERLVQSPDLRRSQGLKGREAAQREFDWASEIDTLTSFYAEVLRARADASVPRRAEAPVVDSAKRPR